MNFGFVEEARRRGSLNRGGSRWDYVFYGLLRSEWKENIMNSDLLTGKLVRLEAVESQAMAESISQWSHDTEYWRLLAGRYSAGILSKIPEGMAG